MPSALQLISSGGFYGAERVLVELALFLKSHGWESRVGVFQTPGEAGDAVAREAEARGLEVVRFNCVGKFDRGTMRTIGKYCREQAIDIAHSHNFKPDVHLRYADLPEKTRRVATCHTWYSHNMKLKMYEWMDRRALRRFDHVVLVAPSLREKVLSSGVKPERTTIIDNGIAPVARLEGEERAALRAEFGIGPEQAMIVRVCRLAPEKCVDLLIGAFAALRGQSETRLVIAGEGDERARLEEEAERLGVRKFVMFTGYRSDAPRIIAAADLFAISSNDEGLPIALLEAMSAGLPIISTAVGAIPTVLEHDKNALLVEANCMGSLVDGMRELLKEPERARRLGKAAHATYELNHSDKAMGEKYLRVYLNAMQENGRR